MNYTLESLIMDFTAHAKDFAIMAQKWNDENPGSQRDANSFVLPEALLTIVTELKKLKDKYEANQPQISTDMRSEESQNPQVPL